jgi:hypothetical protein
VTEKSIWYVHKSPFLFRKNVTVSLPAGRHPCFVSFF